MARVELSHIKKLFMGEASTAPDPELFRELLVMVLARATDADAYTHPAEVTVVQRVIKEFLDEDISSSDVNQNDPPLEAVSGGLVLHTYYYHYGCCCCYYYYGCCCCYYYYGCCCCCRHQHYY